MKNALKVLLITLVVICTLSITIKDETLFSYIYDVISPATKIAQRGAISAYEYSADKTKTLTKKLFENSIPKSDSVKSKFSAPSRARFGGEPSERIAPEEKEELDELIKSHR